MFYITQTVCGRFSHKVKYPEEYNGAIACAPDPIDFRALLPLDVYASGNAFRKRSGLQLKESVTGLARTYTGDMLASLEDGYRFEQALGGALSGGQIGVWMAVYGPKGDDGLPRPLWGETGAIDPEVAAHWRENYDLSYGKHPVPASILLVPRRAACSWR